MVSDTDFCDTEFGVDTEETFLDNNVKFEMKQDRDIVKLYKKRWLMLALYVSYMICNSSQWLQYSIICNIVSAYYGVSVTYVNVTSIIMMVCYIVLSMPAAFLMDRISLKSIAILGSFGTVLGSWIKVFSTDPNGFHVTLAGQTVVALSQVIMLSVPQRLSSVWFGDREVSTACSIGVFGFQAGIVIGFFVPPLLVENHDDIIMIQSDLYYMFLYFAIVSSIVFVMVLIFYKSEPRYPPTISQAASRRLRITSSSTHNTINCLKSLSKERRLIVMFIMTGVNNGCFNGLSTLLSQIFLNYFPGNDKDAGLVGVTMVISGMTASVIYGIILDRTKKFKFILIGIYYMSGISMLCFTYALMSQNLLAVYLTSTTVGTFLCGFTAVSFDVATELTYPQSELIVGTIMNTMSLLFSILATLIFGYINDRFTYYWGNITMMFTLLLGATIMLPLKFDLRRLNAIKK